VRALITGIAGQDGTILATMLEREGAEVFGIVKPGTDVSVLERYAPGSQIIACDLADVDGIHQVACEVAPTELYNLGGFTAPGESWEHAEEVQRVNVDAVRAMISALLELGGTCRMFQASSASVFEGADTIPQTERSRLAPKSPYAKSKAESMELVRAARREHGLFAVAGILYNHESPLRGPGFVTRRISMGVARIAAGLQDVLELGDVEVARDWGWAPDYVRAMQLMVRSDIPHEYVLATGISHRLSFFLARAFQAVGITDWQQYVVMSEDRRRTSDTNLLVGDSHAAYRELGWRHTKDFDAMAAAMVAHDQRLLADPDALWLDF